jgi:hypothetical protein
MAKHPSVYSCSIESLINDYGTTFICDALARFIVSRRNPTWSHRQVENAAVDIFLPFQTLPVFHKIKFCSDPDGKSLIVDSIHVRPLQWKKEKCKSIVPGRFDTALVNTGEGENTGVHGTFLPSALYMSTIELSRPSHCASSRHLLTTRKFSS